MINIQEGAVIEPVPDPEEVKRVVREEARRRLSEKLDLIDLTDEWTMHTDLPDIFRGDWTCSGWGRIIDGNKVFVISSYEGDGPISWKLLVNGKFASEIPVSALMGSSVEAMSYADAMKFE